MVSEFKSDIEIARSVRARPILEIANAIGIADDEIRPYGYDKAKVDLDLLGRLASSPRGKLVLVTAMSPTPAGEGKTTTSVGLCDALNRIGRKALVCLREPSLGPCFGMKGGAAGGGRSQVIPMEEINLHFTGDFHAISSAHNLLAAMIDNHVYWGNALGFDTRRVAWRRVVDMNDRALRQVALSLGGVSNGYPRESGFDITVASEVMAIFCLAEGLEDLERRLAGVIAGYRPDRTPIYAGDLDGAGAMTVLLKDALAPNLVQTLERNPAIVHGGPFANIAHGCNSLVATRMGLGLADYVITEAGFGADLGAEKFFDIKCRKSALRPDAVVIVATVRALKYHGGVGRDQLGVEDLAAVEAGFANLRRHIDNVKQYGLPVVVAVNRFHTDTDEELLRVRDLCLEQGVDAIECTHFARGGAGAEELATRVVELAESTQPRFKLLYENSMPLIEKIRVIARKIYGADDIVADSRIVNQLDAYEEAGFGGLPVCMAKTQYSFSTDPMLRGAPSGHTVPVREVKLSAGAGFIVAICGEIMTMPGLPRVPAATRIRIDENRRTVGLF